MLTNLPTLRNFVNEYGKSITVSISIVEATDIVTGYKLRLRMVSPDSTTEWFITLGEFAELFSAMGDTIENLEKRHGLAKKDVK